MIVLFLALAPAAFVRAEGDPSRAFREFGLEGIWSPDCKRAAAPDNPRVYWRVSDTGPVVHAVTFDGATFALTDYVTSASRLDAGRLRVSISRDGTLALVVTIERVGERIHTVNAVGADGTIYYRDGIEIASGKPSLLDERCGDAAPVS